MDTRINVKGTAVKPGLSRNKVMYTKEELRKFAPTLKGVSIIKDHENQCDNVIGKVTDIYFDEKSGNVLYEGWVENDHTNIANKIQDGRIQHVSIGAIAGRMLKENEDSDYLIAEDLQGVELSTVVVPGVPGASITRSQDEYSEESLREMLKFNDELEDEEDEEELEEKNHIETIERRVKEMENTNETNVQETKISVDYEAKLKETEALLTEKETKLQEMQKQLADIEEAKRQDAIKNLKEICSKKKIKEVDTSKLSLEIIKLLTEMADSVEEAKVIEIVKDAPKVEEVKKEEVKTTVEEVKKEIAAPKSADVQETKQVKNVINGNYVIETSSLGGSCLYKV